MPAPAARPYLTNFEFQPDPAAATATTDAGWLTHRAGTCAVPLLRGMLFPDQLDWPLPELLGPRLAQLRAAIEDKLPAYEEFVRRKARRPTYDAYACFEPFNEATRALLPFVALLRQHLPPGAVILNLWDRTGWFSSLLAGLFPAQTIVTTWDGDRDVLGYKGYAHWLTGPDAPANVQVLFQELTQPLLLGDHSVDLVIGFDVLHHFDQARLLQELLRVARPAAPLLFPHVHLANGQPDPYFERGGRLLTGRQYQRLLSGPAGPTRTVLVYSEPALFEFNEHGTEAPVPDPDTANYNGLVALLPSAWLAAAGQPPLQPFRAAEQPGWEACRVLVNPLLNLDEATGIVRLQAEHLAGAVGHLLLRHPVYERHLAATNGYQLGTEARTVLYWAARQLTVAEIAERLGTSPAALRPLLRELSGRDVMQLVPLNAQSHRLQHYFSFQHYVPLLADQTIGQLWRRAVRHYPDHTLLLALEDGGAFTYAEADQVVQQVRVALRRSGCQPGAAVALHAPLHAEVLLLSWACWLEGLVLVPVSTALPHATTHDILRSVAPRLVLTTAERAATLDTRAAVLLLDHDEAGPAPAGSQWFAEWLGDDDEAAVDDVATSPADVAVILFTSGSTGLPKGVPLTHGQLYRSGRLVTETFGWLATDRFLAVGDADAMSGLRNAALAPLEVGAAVVVPGPADKQSAATLAEALARGAATLVAASPALLRQWTQLGRRVAGDLRSLRLVMSTGSQLTPALRHDFGQAFGIPLVNYYGLTETTGICLAERPEQVQPGADTVGWPVGCLAQVVNEAGQPLPPGERGELRIYGDNLLQGSYVGPGRAAVSPVRAGWLYTGDTAVANGDGSISLVGRLSERIKNAHSEVVYPLEIETHLLAHAAVSEAAVCALRGGETEKLAAFVTLHEGHSADVLVPELRRYLASRAGAHKVPAVLRVLPALPYTPNGKLAKQALLDLLG